eukprot:1415866-Rhodomonas_salina.1
MRMSSGSVSRRLLGGKSSRGEGMREEWRQRSGTLGRSGRKFLDRARLWFLHQDHSTLSRVSGRKIRVWDLGSQALNAGPSSPP